ncbi:MAG: hypothetical protein JOZ94_05610 [Xanthobacteraceae bacterium]|nr:hypothetical protein [Xanthobacteraceae bacterium]MBV9235287.1 hypothetical protein [Xanthobacteraceae bacterium]
MHLVEYHFLHVLIDLPTPAEASNHALDRCQSFAQAGKAGCPFPTKRAG